MVSLSYNDVPACMPARQARRARMTSPQLNWRLLLAVAVNVALWAGLIWGAFKIF